MLTPKITGWSDGYEREVESFVSRIAVRFIDRHRENFPFQTITVGENWLHVASVTYDEARKSEINLGNLVDKIIHISTRGRKITGGLIPLGEMLDYINYCKYDSFAMIPLTYSRNEEVKKLGSLVEEKEKTDFYRIKYNDRIITVIPEIKNDSIIQNKGVYVFINPENTSKKVH